MKKSNKTKPRRVKKRKPDKTRALSNTMVNPAENRGVGMDVVAALKMALEHQQAGQLAEAEHFYRKALEIDPDNAIANQLLGRLAHQKGAHQEAADFFAKALKSAPDNAEIRNNLGNCLIALGHYEEAIGHLERAVELEPEYALAENNLGAALTSAGRPEEAIEHIQKSLKIRPDSAAAHSNLGNALKGLKKFDEAFSQYNRAIETDPEFPEAYYNMGVAFEHQDMFEDAMQAYELAVEKKPDYAEAHLKLGIVFRGTGLSEDEISRYRETKYRKAIALKPDFGDAHNNLGVVLSDAGRPEEALPCFNTAISMMPEKAAAYANLAACLQQLGRLEESEAACRKALELDNEVADAHMILAINLFMMGDVANGWEEYEWRSNVNILVSPTRSFPQPQWDGSSLEGKNILLWGDQGIGDETRFASLIPDMLDKGAAVSIECTPRLVDLFARSFPQATVHGYPFIDGENGEAHFDFQCSFPSLGRFLRPSIETFAMQRDAYLVADTGRKKFWQNRLSEISPRPKIGINWRSMSMKLRWLHYYATIDELAPIMSIPGVDFVNLMYDATEEELDEFERLYGTRLLGWDDIDMKNNIDEVAALNADLDMVVSCVSSVSEMSGALGIPTLIFIGDRKDAVMLGTGVSVWYPKAKYFSKNQNENWRPVFEDVAQEICKTFGL